MTVKQKGCMCCDELLIEFEEFVPDAGVAPFEQPLRETYRDGAGPAGQRFAAAGGAVAPHSSTIPASKQHQRWN